MVTKAIRGVVTTAILALAAAALWPAAPLRAQLPMPASTIFEMTGFIQKATLADATDAFSGGTLTMNNHVITVPRYTIFQMPATSLTWAELFKNAPAPWRPTQTGLALSDTPKPDYTFEVMVQGNRVGDTYIAALVFISNLSLQQHQGFITAIDYKNGEMVVGGTRVRINDPLGRFGRAWTHDTRFTIDEDNPTVKSETGYPMCLPRTDPATADDPLCPQGNRPAGKSIFTMAAAAEPTSTERQNPALRSSSVPALDPWRAAPFEVGDYVTVKGPIVKDAAGQFIAATAVDANVGIFTAPGTRPAYVSIDVILMGTGPLSDATLAQEGAKRTRVEGFTTDFTTPVQISAVDVNACTGEGVDRLWNVEAIDPGPPNGAVAGRWRFRPGAPLFDLKGFPFLPPTREVHASSISGTVMTMNGLSAGEYTAPNFEFILPENRGIGSPVVPGNFENMAFLAQGSGPRGAVFTGQLDPWPGDASSKPVRNACAVVGPDLTVPSGQPVSLDGSQSVAANVPTGPVSFKWTQLSGTPVALANASTASATFTAPTLAVGAPDSPLQFKLTVTPTNGGAAVDSRTVSATVKAPADTVAPKITSLTTSATSALKGSAVTLKAVTSDNVGASQVTFFYTITTVSGQGTILVPNQSPTPTWTAQTNLTLTAVRGSVYSIWAVATDAAGLSSPATAPIKVTVQ